MPTFQNECHKKKHKSGGKDFAQAKSQQPSDETPDEMKNQIEEITMDVEILSISENTPEVSLLR